jgi:hypothetical protein
MEHLRDESIILKGSIIYSVMVYLATLSVAQIIGCSVGESVVWKPFSAINVIGMWVRSSAVTLLWTFEAQEWCIRN